MDLPKTADVVVVGGGIIGAASARALAQAGLKVVLLEARAFGGAVSGASLAGIGTHMHGMEEYDLLSHGCELWRDEAEAHGNPFEYNRSGQLRFIIAPEDIEVGQSWVERERARGADVKVLSSAEARELEPALTGHIYGATWAPSTASVNPFFALRHILDQARALGVIAQANTPVTQILAGNGKIRGITYAGGQIDCGQVLLTGGPWTRKLAAQHGIDLPIIPRQAQCLATTRQPKGTLRRILSACERAGGVDSGYTQIQQAGSGQILFNTVTAPKDTYDGAQDQIHEVPLGFVQESIATLLALCPSFAPLPLMRSWVRFEGVTPDSHFLAGPLPMAGLLVIAGDNGSGFCRALMLAELARNMVSGSSRLSPQLLTKAATLYDPLRFATQVAA